MEHAPGKNSNVWERFVLPSGKKRDDSLQTIVRRPLIKLIRFNFNY